MIDPCLSRWEILAKLRIHPKLADYLDAYLLSLTSDFREAVLKEWFLAPLGSIGWAPSPAMIHKMESPCMVGHAELWDFTKRVLISASTGVAIEPPYYDKTNVHRMLNMPHRKAH